MLVPVGRDDVLVVGRQEGLRDERDVAEKQVAIGVQARVGRDNEALRAVLDTAGLERVAEMLARGYHHPS